MNNTPDILVRLIPFVEILEELGVSYHIGGSVATSIYGISLTLGDSATGNGFTGTCSRRCWT